MKVHIAASKQGKRNQKTEDPSSSKPLNEESVDLINKIGL